MTPAEPLNHNERINASRQRYTRAVPPLCLAVLLGTAALAAPPAAKKKAAKPKHTAKSSLTVVPKRRGAGFRGFPPGGFKGMPPGGFRGMPPGGFKGFPHGGFRGFPGGGGMPGGMEAQGSKVSFEFHGSNIIDVLSLYAKMANETVVADPSLSGNVTIINPTPVSLDQAFMILQQVLAARGFTAIDKNHVISVVPFSVASQNSSLLNPGVNANGPTPVDPRDQVMTQVIPLENVDAETLAKELKPLTNTGASLVASAQTNALILTDTASNVQRFIALAHALDKASDRTELRVYPLRRAQASDIAEIINNVYKQLSSTGAPAGPKPGRPGFPPGQPPAAANAKPAVFAAADPRTNSVLVVASPDNQQRVAQDIIGRLDDQDNNPLTTTVRKIIYANAQDVANLVNTVLSNESGYGAAGNNANFQQRVFGRFAFFGNQNNNQNQQTVTSSDPFGKVVADPRTNSVLITATPDRLRTITRLIDSLDRQVPSEATTFVFPLKNAQASDVAYALSQAFDTQQQQNLGFGNTFVNNGSTFGNNGLIPPKINRSLGSNSLTGRATEPPAPPNAPGNTLSTDVPGVMTPQGFVPTQVPGSGGSANANDPTRQFFRFGFGGNNRSLGQNSGPQYGLGRNGIYSNLLQLQNNVYVTPSPTGDSIIVTTTPDNYDAVKKLVEELDVVPRQVEVNVIIAEVTLSKDQKLGFSLSGLFQNLFGHTNTGNAQINLTQPGFNTGSSGTALDPTATGAQFALNGANYAGLMQALENDSRVKVIATPKIFTSNDQEARITIATQIPYYGSQPISSFGTIIPPQVQYAQVGYQLDVTPRITRDGLVTIDLYAIASDLLQYETLGSGTVATQVPIVNERTADTEVSIQDGRTVAVGGLIQSNSSVTINKIPILSDIPLVGQFFRSREHVNNRTELVIFMTPHVISSNSEAAEMTRKEAATIVHMAPELSKGRPDLAQPTTGKPGTKAAPNAGGPATPSTSK